MDSDDHERHEERPSFRLHLTMKDKSVLERESAVKRGVTRLAILRSILARRGPRDSFAFAKWNEQINKALDQAGRKKAIIGVVGNTGAGKTSLINAILDEGQLLPTNCMRACTATITEIAFSNSLVPYVAEIEYIDQAEWKQELQLGWQILFDANGKIVRDATNEDTGAGVFYAKMKAVYADLTREDLQYSTIDVLLKHPSMSVLGQVDRIEDTSASSFSKRLQLIVDSKEHSDDPDSTKKSSGKRRANWPLIRKASILVKSSALSTGVILVDLPGVQDSNPARAKIATDYLRECSGLLVATPIHRAVDDKVAKNLLGKSFKRQIMMDGGFNTVTFVCTKADDISITEASSSPTIEHIVNQLASESNDIQSRVASLRSDIERLKALKSQAEQDVQKAYEMQDRLEDARRPKETHSTPIGNSQEAFESPGSKRKGFEGGSSPLPKRKTVHFEGPNDDAMNDSQANDSPRSDQRPSEGELDYWKMERKILQKQKQDTVEQLDGLIVQLNENEERLATIESRKLSVCIAERNIYVENALKRDFVAGVKEFDQERLDGDRDTNYDHSADYRDYAKLHNELPVFCVSAKAFQKKLGLLEQEPDLAGFGTREDTGIPKLQEHCKQLTEAGRAKSADFFLAMMSALLNSLSLWVSNELNGTVLTDQQRTTITNSLQQELLALKSKFEQIVANVCGELKESIKSHIYKAFEPAWTNATKEADEKAKGWGQLAHQTWRAICVRYGTFENSNGRYDWNEELVEPILEHLAPKWETTFNELSSQTFHKFGVSCRKAVKDFHRTIPELFDEAGSRTPDSHRLLEGQLESYKQSFENIEDHGKDFVSSQQRLISRAFKPSIQDSMTAAYKRCLEETGSGSWRRMKEHMENHIASSRGMFRDSTKTVQAQLDDLIRAVRRDMLDRVQVVHGHIADDYVNTLVGGTGAEGPHEPTALTDDLLNFLDDTERQLYGDADLYGSGIDMEDMPHRRTRRASASRHLEEQSGTIGGFDVGGEDMDTDEERDDAAAVETSRWFDVEDQDSMFVGDH